MKKEPKEATGRPKGGQGKPNEGQESAPGGQRGAKEGHREAKRQREAKRRPGEAILVPFSCPWGPLGTVLEAWPVLGSIFVPFMDVFSGVFFNLVCLFSPLILDRF